MVDQIHRDVHPLIRQYVCAQIRAGDQTLGRLRKAELEAKRQASAEVGLPATARDAELEQRKAELEAKQRKAEQSWRLSARLSSLPRKLMPPSKHGR